jgi:hypothetical protein
MNQYIIQRLIFPGELDFKIPTTLYFRTVTEASLFTSEICQLQSGEQIVFDTFFNGFSIDLWKKHTRIQDLGLCLQGRGTFLLTISVHSLATKTHLLYEQEIHLNETEPFSQLINEWNSLNTGMLYFSLTSRSKNAQLSSAVFYTHTPPVRAVKLGVVITHFNRRQWVIPAINRFNQSILSHVSQTSQVTQSIDLVIVDNSATLLPEEVGKAILLPNRNLGGSGGFARGLLYLKDHHYTHCLFMDDDASCEIESIKRTYDLLSYTISENPAIAGSLFLLDSPSTQHERGAIVSKSGYRKIQGHGLDMEQMPTLLSEEKRSICARSYGAWWFLAFEIRQDIIFPFPFFVRGDDVLFGLMNQFTLITPNGIACWGDDFAKKNSKLTYYLDTRSILFCASSLFSSLMVTFSRILYFLLSQRYQSAQALRVAIEDASQSTNFWIKNIDLTSIRLKFSSIKDQEIFQELPNEIKQSPEKKGQVTSLRKIPNVFKSVLAILTLNGFLLPNCLLKKMPVRVQLPGQINLLSVFRASSILYHFRQSDLGFVTTHSKKTFFKELFACFKTLTICLMKQHRIKQSINIATHQLTQETFWRQVYQKELSVESVKNPPPSEN